MRVFAFLLPLVLAACATTPAPAVPDFRAALDRHLAAVAGRDLDGVADTISLTDELSVIFPNGAKVDGRQAVIDFHRDWFADKQWVWSPTVVKIFPGAGQSTALVRYDYRDTPQGDPRSNWLALVFRMENGSWRLVHDQNTRIQPPPPTID